MAADGAADTVTTGGGAGLGSRFLDLVVQALPAIGGAAAFLGFVAAVGGGIEWVRFEAAGLPADQAVRVVPKQELVAIGAAALVGFLLLGLLAVLVVYLLDRRGEASAPTRVGLGGLVAFELAVAVAYTDLRAPVKVAVAAALVALAIVAAPLLAPLGSAVARRRTWWRHDLRLRVEDVQAEEQHVRRAGHRCDALEFYAAAPDRCAAARERLALAASRLRHAVERLVADSATVVDEAGAPGTTVAPMPLERGALLRLAAQERELAQHKLDHPAAWRVAGEAHEPTVASERRFIATVVILLAVLSGALAVVAEPRLRWLLLAGTVAVLLALAVLGIAAATERFVWYGVAVFVSVLVYGALLSVDRTFRDPQVQPAALARTTSTVGMCGIYVTQTSDRVYLGRFELAHPGGTDASKGAGRLFWVPLKDVDLVSVGPLQSVRTADWRAGLLMNEVYAERSEEPVPEPKPRTTTVQTTTVHPGRRGSPGHTTVRTVTSQTAPAPARTSPRPVPVGAPPAACRYQSLSSPPPAPPT